MAQGVGPEFKPQYCKIRKKERKTRDHQMSLFFCFPPSPTEDTEKHSYFKILHLAGHGGMYLKSNCSGG
jgi:hypothetical protein